MRMYRQFEVASVSSFPESAVNNVAKNGLVELWEASRTTRFSGKALARSLGRNQICSWLPTLPNGAEAMEEFRDGGGGIAGTSPNPHNHQESRDELARPASSNFSDGHRGWSGERTLPKNFPRIVCAES